MRDIKFRAWDKMENKMVQPREGDFIGWHSPTNWKDCYEIMQFTGLNDKKGNEVYKGDVVRHESWDSQGGSYEIEGFVYWNEDNLSWWIDSGNLKCALYNKKWTKDIEVIGNIYEHSHLIK